MFCRFFLSGRYLKNGVACSVGRRLKASETQSSCTSADSKEPSKSRVGGNEAIRPWTLIVRVYRTSDGKLELAPYGQEIDKKNGSKLTKALGKLKSDFKLGDTITVPDITDKRSYWSVALACCGPKDAGTNDVEALNEKKENIRCCFAAGYKALKGLRCNDYDIEYSTDSDDVSQAAHEGFRLARWTPTKEFTPSPMPISGGYFQGTTLAESQNWARHLSQLPTDEMIPEAIVEAAKAQLTPLGVNVTSYGKKGIKERKMSAFLAVARGSTTEPRLLECEYKGGTSSTADFLLVAKGVTFDSGGLCLKTPGDLLKHNGMTGAAAALGTIRGLAALKAPVHVKVIVPLCENMISGGCLRVGEVVTTLKGLKVKVEDTDLEGHLILADALAYGQSTYKPVSIMSIASLTPGITMATGSGCYGCFTKNEALWKKARDAGTESGDRPWRFPIWDFYGNKITGDTPLFDLKNRGSGIASHCIGAAFLNKFVTGNNWLHYDITGVGKMAADEAPEYLDPNFMTGRPTRALIGAIMKANKTDDDCLLPTFSKKKRLW